MMYETQPSDQQKQRESFSLPSRYGSKDSTGARWGEAWVMIRLTRLGLKRGNVYRARATTPPIEWPTTTTL